MDKTKVVTFRISEEELWFLDDFSNTHYYWRRSYIICSILWAFFHLASKNTQFQIMRQVFSRHQKYRLVLEEIEPMQDKM